MSTLDLFSAPSVVSAAAGDAFAGLAAALEACLGVLKRAQPTQPRFIAFPIASKGPLTEVEKDAIEQLGEQGLKPWSIARRLQRHPSTVTWFMSTLGLKRISTIRKEPFIRAGKQVRPFSPAEDDFMTDCSCAGEPPAVIARKMAARFGHERSRDTVACRLMMLASDEAAREAA